VSLTPESQNRTSVRPAFVPNSTCTCTAFIRWGRPVSAGCDTLPMFDVLKAQGKGDQQCGSVQPRLGCSEQLKGCYGVASPCRPQRIPLGSAAVNRAGHEVIVAHARKVRLIGDSSRKDNRIDAQTLAQLARIDPRLLGPARHGSAKAQIHLTVIRARAGLVSARNGPGEYGARVGEDVWRTAAQMWTWLISRCVNETYSRCKFVVSRA